MANFLDKRDKSLTTHPQQPIVDKIERYKWARPSTTGSFRLVNKSLLNLDDRYQREKSSEEKIRRIARDWDWVLFKTLAVALRPDGSLWIIDGGHRVRAAFYRSDIIDLPCMVFPLGEVADEARAFIAAARLVTHINPIDTYRAASVAKEPTAVKTAAILADAGIRVAKNAYGSNTLKCIHTIQEAVGKNADLASECLKLCAAISNEQAIQSCVFRGLFELVMHFQPRDILKENQERLLAMSQQEIETSMNRFKSECGKGGTTIEAKALMNLLNKNKKNRKLVW